MAIVTTNDRYYKSIATALRECDKDQQLFDTTFTPEGMSYAVRQLADIRYETGYTAGLDVGHDNGFAEGQTAGFQEGIAAGRVEGQRAEYDRFWDAYQRNGKETVYSYAFAGVSWTDDTYNPKYPIAATTGANYMFTYTRITDTKVPIDLGNDLSNKVGVFDHASKLVTIRELIIGHNIRIGTTMFTGCTKLANITITGNIGYTASFEWCPLTAASIRSIVDALYESTSGHTLTLKKSAVEAAFTEDEWAALVATRPNWIFSLV